MPKNRRRSHDFAVTGGYDAALDGDDPQWGRLAVRCRICGEERRIGAPIIEVNQGGGCIRTAGGREWAKGDLLCAPDGALDEFVDWLPGGRAATYNAGGHWHQYAAEDLTPLYGGRSGETPDPA